VDKPISTSENQPLGQTTYETFRLLFGPDAPAAVIVRLVAWKDMKPNDQDLWTALAHIIRDAAKS